MFHKSDIVVESPHAKAFRLEGFIFPEMCNFDTKLEFDANLNDNRFLKKSDKVKLFIPQKRSLF